jgi:transketolase N-terminal domain/subunit
MDVSLKNLQVRLLDQSYKYGLHHLGSAFSTLPILHEIFQDKRRNEKLILSNGHASASLYVTLEAFYGHSSDIYFETMGDHPKRNLELEVDCSTGSLGMGITVAVGMALADPKKRVYCVISDGECAEGSVWESLRFAHTKQLHNLRVYVNINNYIAYDEIDGARLSKEIQTINPGVLIRNTSLFPFENFGLNAHYMKMSEQNYTELRALLCDLPS